MSRRLPPLADRRAALESRHPVWTPRPLHGALDDAAQRWPDRPYVITDERTYSYAEIRDWSLRIARGLVAAAGVQPGERVGLEMANYPEFVATKYAISRTGATAIPINFLNRRDELAYVLRQGRIAVLVVMAAFRGTDYLAMLDDICPGWPGRGGGETLPDLRQVVVFDNESVGGRDVLSLAALEKAAPEDAPLPEVDPSATSDILFTSGTTGGPKGVQLSHDMLLRTAYGAAYGRGFEDGRRIHFAMPMYHVFGYVEGMLPSVFVGGAIIPHTAFDPVASVAAIERHQATDMLAIPLMSMMVMDALRESSADISSLRSIISSGTAAPPGHWDRIDAELPCEEVTTGYGMSETTASTTVVPPDAPPDKRRTTNGRLREVGVVGDPALGGRLSVYRAVDPETGQDLGRNAVGELQVMGPQVTRGYWDKPEATAAAFTEDGWLRTGDLGIIDDEDYIKLVGRAKDCYRCGGEQVVPQDAENVLLTHPGVEQALVVPVPDPKMGETGAALIVPKPGAQVDPQELIDLVAGALARFKVPKHVLFIEAGEIPLTPSGRPRKFLLAELAVERLGLTG